MLFIAVGTWKLPWVGRSKQHLPVSYLKCFFFLEKILAYYFFFKTTKPLKLDPYEILKRHRSGNTKPLVKTFFPWALTSSKNKTLNKRKQKKTVTAQETVGRKHLSTSFFWLEIKIHQQHYAFWYNILAYESVVLVCFMLQHDIAHDLCSCMDYS